MMPAEKSRNANWPAMGRSAAAACSAVSMFGDAVHVQRRRRGEHDAERDAVGEEHADPGVDLDAVQVLGGLLGGLAQRLVPGRGALLLHLLRGLPEEEVGADGGAQHRHERCDVVGAELQLREERGHGRLVPRHVHHEHRTHVAQERQRHPLEQRGVARERHEDLQGERQQREEHDVDLAHPAHQELQRVAHGAQVGGDVDGVGEEQQPDDPVQEPGRVVVADVGGEPVPGDPPDARRDDLDADHERGREQHRPEQPVAVLRAGLRVRRDAARVVVRGAGDEARPEALEQRDSFLFARLHAASLSPRTLPNSCSLAVAKEGR